VLARYLSPGQDFKILATDVDSGVLAKAANGVFPEASIREQVPREYLPTSVDFGRQDVTGWARIKPGLKQKISFKPHNLIELSYPGDEVFEVVFLRNVLMYFNPQTIQFVVEKLFKSVRPGGYLFIGRSESLKNIETSWKYITNSIYRKEAS
ncbi:MAG: hypothetical protein EOP04_24545, partial [Proteobacteria bacterium]